MNQKIQPRIKSPFYDSLLHGYYVKEIVSMILNMSDYLVFPYGYESTLSYIKIQLHKKEISDTPTAQRIRSSPDLLVYDSYEKDIKLVEVKTSNWDRERSVAIFKVDLYKKYWEDCVLVVVIPHGHWFYAQYVNKIEAKGDYDLVKEFKKFEAIFPRVDVDTLYSFKLDLAKKMGRSEDKALYFPENSRAGYNAFLRSFINEHPGLSFDRLFMDYNSENLISREKLSLNLKELIKRELIKEVENKFYLTNSTCRT